MQVHLKNMSCFLEKHGCIGSVKDMFNGLVVLLRVHLVMCVSYCGVCGGIYCNWFTVCYSNYIVCPCWCFFYNIA